MGRNCGASIHKFRRFAVMVFSKETKQTFIHPTKTGTHTTRTFLKATGWKELIFLEDGQCWHSSPEALITKYPNLSNYTIYGFLRDPLRRFESAVLHIKRDSWVNKNLEKVLRQNKINDPLELVSYETFINVFPQLPKQMDIFLKPQAFWLAHSKVTILDFDNLEFELRRISGNTTQSIEVINKANDFGRSNITHTVRDFVREQYAVDYALAKDRLGKEYLQ